MDLTTYTDIESVLDELRLIALNTESSELVRNVRLRYINDILSHITLSEQKDTDKYYHLSLALYVVVRLHTTKLKFMNDREFTHLVKLISLRTFS